MKISSFENLCCYGIRMRDQYRLSIAYFAKKKKKKKICHLEKSTGQIGSSQDTQKIRLKKNLKSSKRGEIK